ncbi:hypothetical protein SynBIOSE41_01896 [Synechococcus sp. BIOS-E4-1]|nr:hypothetical protein SynBIOSE41_01896 [Synechococcus sp. BIOS-E4-1]
MEAIETEKNGKGRNNAVCSDEPYRHIPRDLVNLSSCMIMQQHSAKTY